jgi:hypothetical protein
MRTALTIIALATAGLAVGCAAESPLEGEDEQGAQNVRACLFGSTYREFVETRALSTVGTRSSRTDALTDDEKALVVAGVRVHRPEVTSYAMALSAVDADGVNLVTRRTGDGIDYVAVEYGLGDNSYGAILLRRDRSVVAVIVDGDLERCTVDRVRTVPGSATIAKIDETHQAIVRALRAADANRDGSLTRTEARRASTTWAIRSYLLDLFGATGPTYVGVGAAEQWTALAVADLKKTDADRNSSVSVTESGRASRNARAIFRIAIGDATPTSVQTTAIATKVAEIDALVTSIAGRGGLSTTDVLRANPPLPIRDLLLDFLQGTGVQQPTIAPATVAHWLAVAKTELDPAGPSVTSTEALDRGNAARRLWVAAGR